MEALGLDAGSEDWRPGLAAPLRTRMRLIFVIPIPRGREFNMHDRAGCSPAKVNFSLIHAGFGEVSLI